MKTHFSIVIFTLCISYTANAQLTYVDIDWVIDQTIIMPDGQTDIMEFDIDGDSVNDLRITSWSNHQTGISTVIECLLLSQTLYEGFDVDNCNSLVACFDGTGDPSINGYIYSSDCSNLANEYVKFPFQFEGSAGIHCGFLYVRYEGTTITFEGYAWNETPSWLCICESSGWLSVEEPEPLSPDAFYEYYNLLGQKVDNPSGLVLQVFENGVTKKVFRIE